MSARSQARASSRSFASRLESGSSSRMTGGFVDEGARERHALLLPAGELVRVAAGEMREPDLGQRMCDTCLDLGRAYTRAA